MKHGIKRRSGWWAIFGSLAVMSALGSAACGDDDSTTTPTAAPASATSITAGATATPTQLPLSGDITVFAAASLTDAFKEAGKQFETAHPAVHVAFNFAGSSALATQINQGQPGDVFASADSANMKLVTDKGGADSPVIFATNVPTVVVPSTGSPVASFADLAKPGVKLVLAAAAVPIGNYARQIFTNASAASGGISSDFSDKVLANLKSNEADVKAVLAKIQTGEGDAGVVYTTDAATVATQVKQIPIPDKYNVIAQYPIASLKETAHADVAKSFVSFITSDAGKAILQKFGFGKPPSN
jgi:molybdate transport system substrate-binding protein